MVHLDPVAAWMPDASVTSVNDVVCPVYDTLSADDYGRYAQHRFNAARFVVRPKALSVGEFVRTASAHLRESLSRGAFVRDPTPAFYAYGIRFTLTNEIAETLRPEKRRERYLLLGLVGTLPLTIEGSRDVAPHERTFADRVEERVRLTDETEFHFAPILCGYDMPDHRLNNLLETHLGLNRSRLVFDEKRTPTVRAELEGSIHSIWRIADPGMILEIQAILSNSRLMILDGHHRFAAAMTRRKMGKPSHPFVMVVEYGDRALLLHPWHRVLRPAVARWNRIEAAARGYFGRVERIPGDAGVPDVIRALRVGNLPGERGCVAVNAGHAVRLAKPANEEYDDFDVVHDFLEQQLHLDSHAFEFVRSPRAALDAVGSADGQDHGTAFLFPPLDPRSVEERAFGLGRVMVQKSTMFLPKVVEGLIFAPANG